VNKAQWITIGVGVLLVAGLFRYGKTSPHKSQTFKAAQQATSPGELTTDSILFHAKETLKPEQVTWMNNLEQSVIRGDVKSQKLDVFHQLAHFWKDSARVFEPYAWYEAEAARLENSEKSLTFAAHLLLENLRNESSDPLRKWKALQAKDLFERSLRINDKNDSTIVGLGACYIFGNIAENPMEGVLRVRQVAERDSTNIFANMVLAHGSFITEQYDKAIDRFGKVVAVQPTNLEAVLMLAETYERKADKTNAIKWYSYASRTTNNSDLKTALEKRIIELRK